MSTYTGQLEHSNASKDTQTKLLQLFGIAYLFSSEMKSDGYEQIIAAKGLAGIGAMFMEGTAKTKIIQKEEGPLEEGKFKVMVELEAAGLGKDRAGLDLVIVVDVSGSMGGKKMERMKTALQFVIRKLSPIDRLSVVVFSREGERLFPLRQVNKSSQEEIEDVVNSLVAGGGTDIAAGLETGLKVLNDQCDPLDGRVAALMLMSDGYSDGADASLLPISDVPVYTFGFGSDHDPTILKAIADVSNGGTFSEVKNTNDLCVAFSQCLAGLVTVVVRDLNLTITPLESTIETVAAGNYPQFVDSATGSVTVSIGDVYDKELRKVMVNLSLSAVTTQQVQEVLRFTYSYRYVGMPTNGRKRFDGNPQIARITRSTKPNEPEKEEVIIEEKRLQVIQLIKDARLSADENKFEIAKQKLEEATKVELLKSEVQYLLQSMSSEETYKMDGRSFALSLESSHERQRFAAKGGDVTMQRWFATPRMDSYLEQAKSFPAKMVVTKVDEDVKQEFDANPLAPIAPVVTAFKYYLQNTIQALDSLDNALKKAR